jgi:hypothetical protein
MLATALALGLLLQAPAASRPGTATITGQLKTVDGRSADDVRVSALQAPPPGVRPVDGIQYYLSPPPVRTVMTDKEGRYRLANLPPGRYFIAAGIPGQDTYYPDATDGYDATIVTVAADSTTAIDFALVAPLAGRISGRVTPPPASGVGERAILSGVLLTDLVDAPVRPDGTFEFGRVPAGTYLVDLFPTVPGLQSVLFDIGERDVNTLELKRPKLQTITGRIEVERGPLPSALFAFYTDTSYAAADIRDDRTFTVRLHAATHLPDLGGMPSDYELKSVRLGNQDVTKGLVVGDRDLSGVVVTVSAPDNLPTLRGRITGVSADRLRSMKVEATGPIVGSLQADVRPDGSFEFAAVTPGGYWVRIPTAPAVAPEYVAVDFDGGNVAIKIP